MRWVRLENRKVVEIKNEMSDGFIYANDDVSGGWMLDEDGNFKPPELSDEDKLKFLRQRRNFLLAQTDWMAVQDRVMTEDEKKYRQELRDITKKYKSLDDVIFPTLGGD